MDNILKKSTIFACGALLRPIISILLKCGFTWKEFSEIAKWIFVDVASNDYGIKGRPTNMARVCILTGINRKEVKRQRDIPPIHNYNSDKASDATRILFAWHHDANFVDESNKPRELLLTSDSHCFAKLHKIYGGDVSMQGMLKELIKSGSIEAQGEGENTRLKVLRSYFMPKAMDSEMILHAGKVIKYHADTLNNNITQNDECKKFFEGYAAVHAVDKKHQEKFQKLLKQKGQLFLEEIDEWLEQHRVTNDTGTPVSLGLGMYAIQSNTDLQHGKQEKTVFENQIN